MKNLYFCILVRSLRLCRQFVWPARMVLSQVAVGINSVQILLPKNKYTSFDTRRFRKTHALLGMICLFALFSFILFGGKGTSLAHITSPDTIAKPEITPLSIVKPTSIVKESKSQILVSSADELIQVLKLESLWNLDKLERVPNILISRFPADLATTNVPDKKKVFIASLLPAAVLVVNEVRLERQQLTDLLDKIGGEPSELIFSKTNPEWMDALGENNVDFLAKLTKKYRTNNAAELLSRINVLPLSLIIAQGAIESSWGSSRFAVQANNLFGMWTWGKKGLVPLRRDSGKTHRIALYDSIVDSVRAYVLTINRVSAYDELRSIRQQTLDSLSVSDGLFRYSERKELYVEDVKRVIQANNLKNYDNISFSAI